MRFSLQASAYLDALRIGAALLVMLHHFGTQRISGGFLWQIGHYGPSRVVLFFVLSGFLVAASLDRATANGKAFATSRIARFASVLLPAALITAALDAAGTAWRPEHYADLPPILSALWIEQYARALTLTGMSWGGVGMPGSNGAWWTLGIEVVGCAAYGVLKFTRGWVRAASLAGLALVAGPIGVALAPVWLAGAVAYQAFRSMAPSKLLAGFCAVAPVAACLAWEVAIAGRSIAPRGMPHDALLLSYATAAGFAVHLAGMGWLLASVPGGASWVSRSLRWVTGATFTLYLLHMPLGRFLAAVSPWEASSLSHRLVLIGGTVLAALALAQVTERRVAFWRGGVERLFARRQRQVAAQHG